MTISLIDLGHAGGAGASEGASPPTLPLVATPEIDPTAVPTPVEPLVTRVRRRLGRIAGRELLIDKAGWVIGAGALLACSRPFFWPLGDTAPLWLGFARAAGLFAAGSAVTALGLVIAGRRRGPTALGAARAIDHAAGLAEVVASGFAFERDPERRTDPIIVLARRRAAEAAARFETEKSFPLPSLLPSRRSLGRVARFSLACAVALCIGAYDRVLLGALISPPTEDETAAAADLEAAAADLEAHLAPPAAASAAPDKPQVQREKADDKGPSPKETLADKAREAVHAARRGDRQGALSKLEDLRAGGRQEASRARELNTALRKIADALDAPKAAEGKSGSSRSMDPTPKAADALRLLAQKTRASEGKSGASNKEERERILERLERAAEEARRSSGEGKKGAEDQAASEAAKAMAQAAEALSRGDREAASKALEEAAKRAEAMEQAREKAAAQAAAVAEMLEKSGLLEEAIQMALLGKEGKDGEGQGQGEGKGGEKGSGEQAGKDGKSGKGEGAGSGGLKRALAARLAALGIVESRGGGVDGGGPASERRRAPRAGLEAKGSIRAPSQVTEGERAIQAIQGLGKGSEPPSSYREVFPSYDAAVEEGIADERIPPARRAAVRRYFQSIRPDQAE